MSSYMDKMRLCFSLDKKDAESLRCRRCGLVLVAHMCTSEIQIAAEKPHKMKKTAENSAVSFIKKGKNYGTIRRCRFDEFS